MLVINNSSYYHYNIFEENVYNLEIALFFNFATKYIMDNCLFKYFCNICKGYVRNKISTPCFL